MRVEPVEGRESVLAALRAHRRRFQIVLLRRDVPTARVAEILELCAERGVPTRYCEREELDRLTHGATHGGVVALCSPRPRWSIDQLIEHLRGIGESPLLLLIEGIDDARNLGFTLRSADALGAHAVLVKKHLWDFDATEVSRPSSGAYERLALVQLDSAAGLKSLQKTGLRLVGCIAGAKRMIHDIDLRQPVILAIGGEKRGLSGAVREQCDVFATIPTRPGGSSLALSHAAAIVLAEALRQRRDASDKAAT